MFQKFSALQNSIGGVRWLPIVLVVFLGVLANSRHAICDDTSWYIDVIERMHQGEVLYQDIIEVNPPFSVWLYIPPVQLATASGIRSEVLVAGYTILLALFGVLFGATLNHLAQCSWQKSFQHSVPWILGIFVVLAGNAFTQREHIGAVLMIPFLVLQAARGEGNGHRIPTRYAILAGVSSSVLVLLKPHYAVIHLTAFVLLNRTRFRLKNLWLPEYWTVFFFCCAYVPMAYWSYPRFFTEVLPLLNRSYLLQRHPMVNLTPVLLPVSFPVLAYFWCRTSRQSSLVADNLFWAGLAALIPFFMMGKGFLYHAYPSLSLLGSAAVASYFSPAVAPSVQQQPSSFLRRLANTPLLIVVALFPFYNFQYSHAPPAAAIQAITRRSKEPRVEFIGAELKYGLPLARQVNGVIESRYYSDWLAEALYNLRNQAAKKNETEQAEEFQQALDEYLLEKLHRLQTAPPDVVWLCDSESMVSEALEQHGLNQVVNSDNYDFVRLPDTNLLLFRKPREIQPGRQTDRNQH